MDSEYIDDSIICDAFDELENKSLVELHNLIKHYEYLVKEKLERLYRYPNFNCLSDFFKDKEERRVFYETFFYTKDEVEYVSKYVKIKIKKYITLIKSNLDKCKEIYKEKSNESKDVRREKKKNVLCNKKICECGAEVSMRNFAEHKKSKKHVKYLENLQEVETSGVIVGEGKSGVRVGEGKSGVRVGEVVFL